MNRIMLLILSFIISSHASIAMLPEETDLNQPFKKREPIGIHHHLHQHQAQEPWYWNIDDAEGLRQRSTPVYNNFGKYIIDDNTDHNNITYRYIVNDELYKDSERLIEEIDQEPGNSSKDSSKNHQTYQEDIKPETVTNNHSEIEETYSPEDNFILGMKEFKSRNFNKSLEYLNKSAKYKNEKAEYNIGVLFECGLGVDKDFKEAEKWYRKADKHGNKGAKESIQRITKKQNGWLSFLYQ